MLVNTARSNRADMFQRSHIMRLSTSIHPSIHRHTTDIPQTYITFTFTFTFTFIYIYIYICYYNSPSFNICKNNKKRF